MLRGFALSIAQLGDPRIVRVLAASLAVTLLLFVGLGMGIGWVLAGQDPCDWLGFATCGFGASAGAIGATVLTLAAMCLLFPAVAIGVISGFTDRIVAAVEARHYPGALASARVPGWGETAALGLASAGRLIVLNLIALPVYILLLVTGVGTVFAFLIVNGIVLGRDLGDMVAVRHLDRDARAAWRVRTRGARFVLGVGVAALFSVPIVNLIAPVLGAAMATHLFHRSRA